MMLAVANFLCGTLFFCTAWAVHNMHKIQERLDK